LWTWFTPKGKLRPNYLQVAEKNTTMKHLKQHMPILEEYPTLQDELVTMLQKMRSVGQPLSTSLVQPILKGMIKSFALEILHNGPGGFVVIKEWTTQ
jgi:hypothetical protein